MYVTAPVSFAQRGNWIVIDSQASFFLNNPLFRFEILLIQKRIDHAIGFKLELNMDFVSAHGGKVNCHIGGCKSICLAAVFGDDLRILLPVRSLGCP